MDEARNVSQFSEMPGIVSVKDFFYENETAYIVMEYIDGLSLKDYLQKQGRLPEADALRILRPVLDALVRVHEAGMIHRDISPDNIMLTFGPDGEISSVKLIDFGAARMTEKNDQKSLTIILKHGYAPEEQYRSHGEQGPWTDVYAICATLYRMLTGETPVPAMDRLFQDDLRPLDSFGISVSAGTAAAVQKGMAVKREDRIGSIPELIGAMYEGKAVKKTAKRGKQSRVLAAAVCVCIALAAGLGFAVWNGQRSEPSAPSGDASIGDSSGSGSDTGSGSASGSLEGTGGETIVEVDEQGELGPQIVEYRPWASIAGCRDSTVLFCLPDGTVEARGSNVYGQCRVEDWHDMVAVAVGPDHSLGLRSDGKVFAEGDNGYGQCDVENWDDVIEIAAYEGNSFGLRRDGTILAAGLGADIEALAKWKNMKTITATYGGLAGVDADGAVYTSASDQPLMTGWSDVVHLEWTGTALVGLRENGTLTWFFPDPDTSRYAATEELDDMTTWTDVQQFSTWNRTMAVKTDGTVVLHHRQGSVNDLGPAAEEAMLQWDHLLGVMALGGTIYGLQEDGTILQYMENRGNAELSDLKNLEWVQLLRDSYQETLAGKTKDGQLLTYGCDTWAEDALERYDWDPLYQDIAGLKEFIGEDLVLNSSGTAGGLIVFSHQNAVIGTDLVHGEFIYEASNTDYDISIYAGLKQDGHVDVIEVKVGDYPQNSYGDGWKANVEELRDAETWEHVVQLAYNGNSYSKPTHWVLYGVMEDGTVRRTGSTEVLASDVSQIALYEDPQLSYRGNGTNLLVLHKDGTVEMVLATDVAVRMGMTQTGNWSGITDIAIGSSHAVGLRSDGTVVAAGSNYAGQCDVSDWKDIVFITAGQSCTIGLTSDGELKMAGELY